MYHSSSSTAHAHRVKLFIQRVGKTDHKISPQGICGRSFDIVNTGGLVYTQRFVKKVVNGEFDFTAAVLENKSGE